MSLIDFADCLCHDLWVEESPSHDTSTPPKYSIVVPIRNEEDCIESVVGELGSFLIRNGIPLEIVAVLDGCTDSSESVLKKMFAGSGVLKIIKTPDENRGFGVAVSTGLRSASGDFVAIMMADGSDSPSDALKYYEELSRGSECVFGSRFIKGGSRNNYPKVKLVLNRIANWAIQRLFGFDLNDTTNAFKAYRRHVISGISPLISKQFNITVEIPVKAMLAGYSYSIIPISWENRKAGESKLRIREMGSKYLMTCLYLWAEKSLKETRRRCVNTNSKI